MMYTDERPICASIDLSRFLGFQDVANGPTSWMMRLEAYKTKENDMEGYKEQMNADALIVECGTGSSMAVRKAPGRL